MTFGDNDTTHFLRGDGTWNTPPTVTTGAPGYCPTLDNTVTHFLRGDGTFTPVTGTALTVSTKTASFDASDGGSYYYRLTTNSATCTLPASPANGSIRKFKVITAGKTLTFALNGAETINHENGVSDQVLTLTYAQGVIELVAVTGGWDIT